MDLRHYTTYSGREFLGVVWDGTDELFDWLCEHNSNITLGYGRALQSVKYFQSIPVGYTLELHPVDFDIVCHFDTIALKSSRAYKKQPVLEGSWSPFQDMGYSDGC